MAALAGYLALGTIDPVTRAFTELSGAGAYARQPVSLAPTDLAGGAVQDGGVIRNTADITFPVATGADWPVVNAYALYDAVAGGNLLLHWGVSSAVARSVRIGRTPWTIRAGLIALTPSGGGLSSSHGTAVQISAAVIVSSAGLAIVPGLGAAIGVVTASRALSADDNGKVLRVESAGAVTLTVPSTLPEGFNVALVQYGAGAVTFAAGSGVTKRSSASATSKQYGMASVFVPKASEFILGGDVA